MRKRWIVVIAAIVAAFGFVMCQIMRRHETPSAETKLTDKLVA